MISPACYKMLRLVSDLMNTASVGSTYVLDLDSEAGQNVLDNNGGLGIGKINRVGGAVQRELSVEKTVGGLLEHDEVANAGGVDVKADGARAVELLNVDLDLGKVTSEGGVVALGLLGAA